MTIKQYTLENGIYKTMRTEGLLISRKITDLISILPASGWTAWILLFPFKSERHPGTNVPGLENGKQGDYLTDTLTDKAISFIKENKDQPFFINLWYYTVHTPIQPKKSKLAKYQKKAEALGYNQKHEDGIPVWNSITRKRQDSPAYACMVESMDENIGRVLETLKSQKLEQERWSFSFLIMVAFAPDPVQTCPHPACPCAPEKHGSTKEASACP